MKKKVLAVLLTGVLAAGILTGCGGAADDAAETPAAEETQEEAAPAEEETAIWSHWRGGTGNQGSKLRSWLRPPPVTQGESRIIPGFSESGMAER